MSRREALESELETIDEELEELTAESTGFDLTREIRRLRSALFSEETETKKRPGRRFTSKHERVERIKELQRERERIRQQLAELQTTARSPGPESTQPGQESRE